MSKFLAPIHQWMYHKVHYLDDLAKAMYKEGGLELEETLEREVAPVERRPLEEVVDQNNIHGWIQNQVELAEKRLALTSQLLQLEGKDLEFQKEVARKMGEKVGFDGTASEAFGAMSGHFLDGMPCDRVLEQQKMEEDHAVWKVTKDVHGPYWKNPADYWSLRAAWMEGLLKNSKYHYEEKDGVCEVKDVRN